MGRPPVHERGRTDMTQKLARLETPIPGLHASAPHPLPFDTSIVVRAFLLERGDGNLLVYSAPTVADDGPAIVELGGVWRQYLNHWHEAAFGGAGALGAALHVHEADRERVEETAEVAGTFSAPGRIADDFEIVPIPGHRRRDGLPVGQRRPPRPVHRRLGLRPRRRVGRGAARGLERAGALRREPRAPSRARLRRACAVGGRPRRAVPRAHRPHRRPAPPR
jgi:hypothetical protein